MSVEKIDIRTVRDYSAAIHRGAAALNEGQILALPTETVYGAAGVLNKPEAVARLRAMRNGDSKPFTIHLAASQAAYRFVGEVGELGHRMIRKLWPGPIAIAFDVPAERRMEIAAAEGVAQNDLFDGETITLRCPDHIVATDILLKVPGPVAFTRAASGDRAPTAADMEGKASMIFDAGPCRFSKPSTIVKLLPDGKKYQIVRAGVYDERIIDRLLTTTVLFVCSGNTCRSPMAEAIARRIVAEKLKSSPDALGLQGINVVSAGSFAMPGSRATPQAVDAVRTLGADLSHHRSQILSVELIHQADVIFAMGRSHAAAVTLLVSAAAEKTMTLDPTGDIDDPIGGDAPLYQELAVFLERLIGERLNETLWGGDPSGKPLPVANG